MATLTIEQAAASRKLSMGAFAVLSDIQFVDILLCLSAEDVQRCQAVSHGMGTIAVFLVVFMMTPLTCAAFYLFCNLDPVWGGFCVPLAAGKTVEFLVRAWVPNFCAGCAHASLLSFSLRLLYYSIRGSGLIIRCGSRTARCCRQSRL